MADNTTFTPGAGATLKLDDVGSGVLAQDVKVGHGADGVWTYVQLSAGLPIQPHKPTTQAYSWSPLIASSSGDNTLVSVTGGQTVRLFGMMFTVASQVSIIIKDSTPTNFTGTMTFGTNGGMVLDITGEPWFVTAAGQGLVINLSAAVSVAGVFAYTRS